MVGLLKPDLRVFSGDSSSDVLCAGGGVPGGGCWMGSGCGGPAGSPLIGDLGVAGPGPSSSGSVSVLE